MSKVEIYYFSGTGNSLVVARDLTRKTNGKLIPVISVIGQERINTEADIIGIVFPIYDHKPPQIIENFIGKLTDIGSKYIFAVCTYGVVPLKAMKKVDADIKACGGKLSAGFIVQMPHNALGYSSIAADKQKKMFENWSKKLEVITEYVHTQKEGCVETTNVLVHYILSGLIFKVLPSLTSLLWHAMWNGWESLGFISNEKCNGCGTCARICPVNNVAMVENKPSWSDHCAMCFACLQWCPKESIQAGSVTVNMKRYHHPDVKLSEMLRENQYSQ